MRLIWSAVSPSAAASSRWRASASITGAPSWRNAPAASAAWALRVPSTTACVHSRPCSAWWAPKANTSGAGPPSPSFGRLSLTTAVLSATAGGSARGVPLVDSVGPDPALDGAGRAQIRDMCERFGQREAAQVRRSGPAEHPVGELHHGARLLLDQLADGGQPPGLRPDDDLDAPRAVGERPAMAGQHQTGGAIGDAAQGVEVAAQR